MTESTKGKSKWRFFIACLSIAILCFGAVLLLRTTPKTLDQELVEQIALHLAKEELDSFSSTETVDGGIGIAGYGSVKEIIKYDKSFRPVEKLLWGDIIPTGKNKFPKKVKLDVYTVLQKETTKTFGIIIGQKKFFPVFIGTYKGGKTHNFVYTVPKNLLPPPKGEIKTFALSIK